MEFVLDSETLVVGRNSFPLHILIDITYVASLFFVLSTVVDI